MAARLTAFSKFILTMVVLIILVSSWWVISSVNNISIIEETMSNNIGKRVVIDEDTLRIVDYDIFFGKYIVRDGTKIDREFLETLKIID